MKAPSPTASGSCQRVRAAAAARGASLPDWAIVQKLANALGADWVYAGPADVMREISELNADYRGISYAKLDEAGVQVPCASDDTDGTPILFADGFASRKARFVPAPAAAAQPAGDGLRPADRLGEGASRHRCAHPALAG